MSEVKESEPPERDVNTRDLMHGNGRIVWAVGDGLGRAPGWVLPGGVRTQNRGEAMTAARQIDALSR